MHDRDYAALLFDHEATRRWVLEAIAAASPAERGLAFAQALAMENHGRMLVFAQAHAALIHLMGRGFLSGVCLRIGLRFFVATCGHAGQDEEGRPVSLRDVPLDEIGILTGLPHPQFGLRPVGRGSRVASGVDVGWLEVSMGGAREMGRWFLGLEGLSCDPVKAGDALYVCGYPDEQTDVPTRIRVEGKVAHKCQPIGHSTEAVWPVEGDSDHDVFVDYPEETKGWAPSGYQKRVPPADGLSGCAIWTPRWQMDGTWAVSDARLSALQHSWAPKGRWLHGTLIRDWLTMMRDDFSALADDIAPFLAEVTADSGREVGESLTSAASRQGVRP